MKRTFLLLLLSTGFSSALWSQSEMKMFINGKEEALNKPYYKVGATDSVTIQIQVPAGVDANGFLSKVEAQVCEYIQHHNQSQQQKTVDKVVLFEKISDALRKTKAYYPKPVMYSIDGRVLKITFRGAISPCVNKFFWIKLSVRPAYAKQAGTIKNYQSEIRLKRKNEES